MYCPACGKEVPEDSAFCVSCGVPLSATVAAFRATIGASQSSAAKAFRHVLQVLKVKPVLLWGLSMLCSLLSVLAVALCAPLPIVFIPVILTLQAGMAEIFLEHLRGRFVTDSAPLFAGFKQFRRVAAGMCWQALWLLIWGLVPLAGPVLAIVKSYQYRFTPYILLKNTGVTPLDALKLSKQMTKGKRGAMFAIDFIVYGSAAVLTLVLGLLSLIPLAGYVFRVINFVFLLAFGAVAPLFSGLVKAYFYNQTTQTDDEVLLPPSETKRPARVQFIPIMVPAPQPPVQPTAEKPAEKPEPKQEIKAEKAQPAEETEKPEEKKNDAPAAKAGDKPTAKANATSAEKPAAQPQNNPAEKPADKPEQKTKAAPAPQKAASAAEKADKAAVPAAKAEDKPAAKADAASADNPAAQPQSNPAEKPAEKPAAKKSSGKKRSKSAPKA